MTIKSSGKGTFIRSAFPIIFFILFFVVIMIFLMFVMDIGKTREITFSIFQTIENLGNREKNDGGDKSEELKSLKWQLEKLDEKETELTEREDALIERERKLAAREEEVEQLLAENETLKQSLTSQVEELQQVIKLYERMEAETAARLLEKADNDFASYVLKNMKQGNAAEIIGLINVDKAAAIMDVMTGGQAKS